jgi:hypothetical protein
MAIGLSALLPATFKQFGANWGDRGNSSHIKPASLEEAGFFFSWGLIQPLLLAKVYLLCF